MTNAVGSEKYAAHRKSIEKFFAEHEPMEDETKEHISPSGNYKLVITPYSSGEGYWNYNMGVVLNARTDEEVSVVLRNYGSFPFQWAEHPNGNEYLFCGEDYQGYTCINLTEKKKYDYFHENGFKGWGFCWAGIKEYDKELDDVGLRVEGCYWGGQYENVVYNISKPEEMPYPELSREDVPYDDDWDDEEDEEDDD